MYDTAEIVGLLTGLPTFKYDFSTNCTAVGIDACYNFIKQNVREGKMQTLSTSSDRPEHFVVVITGT
jgi:hypothetical protein